MSAGLDLLLDPLTGDLVVVDGDLVVVEDIAQIVSIRLKFFRNDWFLNQLIGIPYFEEIFIKNPKLDQIEALYRAEIAATPGVTSVLSVHAELDKQTRELTVTWKADTTNGEIGGEV